MKLPRHAEIWLVPYIQDHLRRWGRRPPQRVWLAITDHWEPYLKNQDEALADERVAQWRKLWPEIAARHQDSGGRCPQYSFFYPQEDYRPRHLEALAEMVRVGLGDVEVHIHHGGEGEAGFVQRMELFLRQLENGHGLLRRVDGQVRFGFIHGNWALDNSHPLGHHCGLSNELLILKRLGCYADFTMPPSPSPMQPRMVNAIYWAKDDPERSKSYDRGVPVAPGSSPAGDLLMITGPFGPRLDLGARRLRLEIGELAHHNMPSRQRVCYWLDAAPRVGAGDAFIKLFAHGAPEPAASALLRGGLDLLFNLMREECRKREIELHYVTAWEMYQRIEAIRNQAALP